MISVLFQTETHFPVNRQKVRDALVGTLSKKMKRDTEVSVTIIGDRAMKKLNTRFRNISETTDVLSFGLNDPTDKSVPFVG